VRLAKIFEQGTYSCGSWLDEVKTASEPRAVASPAGEPTNFRSIFESVRSSYYHAYSHRKRVDHKDKLHLTVQESYDLLSHRNSLFHLVQTKYEHRKQSNANEELTRIFDRLALQWKLETIGISAPQEKFLNDSYLQIIGLGKPVLPLIFKDLKENGGPWFWALTSITRAHPVPTEHVGNVRLMKKAWLDFARENGFLHD
jgi:hypothetical protein